MAEREWRDRWMGLPWGVIGLALAVVLGGIGIVSLLQYPHERPTVRLVVPMYALALYLVLALLVNQRRATVGQKDVRVRVGPFPVVPPRRMACGDVRYCYVRPVAYLDDGTVLELTYFVGVAADDGRQLDLGRRAERAAAEEFAGAVAAALEGGPVAIREVDQIPTRKVETVLAVGLWLVLFLLALGVGVWWEMQAFPAV